MSLKKESFQGALNENQRQMLNRLFLAMYSTIYRYAITNVQDPDLAEELTQIVFTKACNNPERIFSSPNAKGWLVKTLRHTLQEYYRKRDRDLRLNERSAVHFSPVHHDDYFYVEYSDLLSSEDMQLLRMVDVEGYSTRAAAETFHISEAACRKRLQRARERLKEKII